MSDYDHEAARRVLDLSMPENDARAATIREYLLQLLRALWREESGFSGKRPFGNSDWQYDLYIPLHKAGLIDGRLDEDGYVEEMDHEAGARLILAAIDELGRTAAA